MPQSLAKVYLHCVFSTKYREPLITDAIRNDLHAYIVGTLSKIGSYTEEIYANPDHIHILCTLPRTITIARLISKMKTPSSSWMKKRAIETFSWQDGYGAFSVSPTKLDNVKRYIQLQPKHHNKEGFQDEFRRFLRKYKIDYDERYVWD